MILTAYYDLAVSPPTYDFLTALCMIERERLRVGADGVEIVLLPGPKDGFRKAPLWPYTTAGREAALQNIVIPMAGLLPSCVGVRRQADRNAEGYGVFTALHGFPNHMTLLREGIRPLRALSPKPGNYVTITLREAEHWPSRNSNVAEWLYVAEAIQCLGYRVIFIRDTRKADEPLEGFETSPLASRDLMVRADLYAGAVTNLGTGSGPMCLAVFMGAPFIMAKILASDAVCCDEHFFASCGWKRGEQYPTSPPYQRVVWEDDKAQTVMTAFREAVLREAA